MWTSGSLVSEFSSFCKSKLLIDSIMDMCVSTCFCALSVSLRMGFKREGRESDTSMLAGIG